MAIAAGLLAALVWATGNLAASRASRAMPPESLLAGISLVGLVICVPLLVAEGAPRDASAGGLCWLALGGAANIAGLSFLYVAYRVGDVGLVAPITSTEGAVAAVIAIAAGQRLHVIVLILLAVIVLGVVRAADRERRPDRRGWSLQLGGGHGGLPRRDLLRTQPVRHRPCVRSRAVRMDRRIPADRRCHLRRAPTCGAGRIRITRAGAPAPAASSMRRGRGLQPLLRSSPPVGRGRRGAGIAVRRVRGRRRGDPVRRADESRSMVRGRHDRHRRGGAQRRPGLRGPQTIGISPAALRSADRET